MINLSSILSPERCRSHISGASQRKLFEALAACLSDSLADVDSDTVVQALLERERLGSTALGEGIAIPHCRLENSEQVLGSLITLEEGLDLGAPDGQKVDLIFALIVPAEAHEEHLQILSQLAQGFQDRAFCNTLRRCDSDSNLYQSYINYQYKLEAS